MRFLVISTNHHLVLNECTELRHDMPHNDAGATSAAGGHDDHLSVATTVAVGVTHLKSVLSEGVRRGLQACIVDQACIQRHAQPAAKRC
jgi:hypothetical protein